jgi:hypothetical protein
MAVIPPNLDMMKFEDKVRAEEEIYRIQRKWQYGKSVVEMDEEELGKIKEIFGGDIDG